MKLLLVEDHAQIARIVFEYFEIKGHVLDCAYTGPHGLELALHRHYDVIVLDLTLPGMDGLDVCRALRRAGVTTPILMLTARDKTEDILAGYDHGTDGYLVKPFDLKVLEARVHALHRRHVGNVAATTLRFSGLSLDLETHTALRDGLQVKLNKTLFIILKTLMLRAPGVATREELIDEIWGDDEPETDLLRSHVYQLRAQIDKPFDHSYIVTVPKSGYQLAPEPAK